MTWRACALGGALGVRLAGSDGVFGALSAYARGYNDAVEQGKAVAKALEAVVSERAAQPQQEYTWQQVHALYQAMKQIDSNEMFMDAIRPPRKDKGEDDPSCARN